MRVPIVEEGLENASYLIDAGHGQAGGRRSGTKSEAVSGRSRSSRPAGGRPHSGAIRTELAGLRGAGVADVADGPLTVMCGHGQRAMTAASLLAQAGDGQLTVLAGGADDWAAATGGRLERSR
ncbi:MAG TPA: hypothetical protein VFP61_11390 [Acidimicrobiales bacterium]|nr:hypothetical protein [Acidimicrobiales bacterium]